MPQRKIHSVNKVLTEEERVRHRAIREQVEQEKAALMARGRRAKARHTMLKEAVAALKTTREALGLSLAHGGQFEEMTVLCMAYTPGRAPRTGISGSRCPSCPPGCQRCGPEDLPG